MNSSAVVVATWGRPSRSALHPGDAPGRTGPCDATITRSVRSRSTGLAGLRNEPQAQLPAGAPGLEPHDLAPQQQAEPVLQDADDVGRQRPVGLAAQVGDVDGDAAAGLELARRTRRTRPRAARGTRCTTPGCPRPELLLVLLAGEVGRRGDHERHRRRLHAVHRAGVAQVDLVDDARRRGRWRRRTAPAAGTARRTRPSRGSRGGTRRSADVAVGARRRALPCATPPVAPSATCNPLAAMPDTLETGCDTRGRRAEGSARRRAPG